MTEAQDELLDLMRRSGIAITRENYIDIAWGQPLPDWTPELEAELPDDLQDFSLFEMNDNNELVLKKGAYPRSD